MFALVDCNNNGAKDLDFEYALTGNTVSVASAIISVSYTINQEMILSLEKTKDYICKSV